jgi:hypothetical protein
VFGKPANLGMLATAGILKASLHSQPEPLIEEAQKSVFESWYSQDGDNGQAERHANLRVPRLQPTFRFK